LLRLFVWIEPFYYTKGTLIWRSINRATDSDIGECDFAILTLCFEDKIAVGCCEDNEPFKNNPALLARNEVQN
jgi:hypothetical protein